MIVLESTPDVTENAILDGIIPNDYDAAFELMEQEAERRGVKRP